MEWLMKLAAQRANEKRERELIRDGAAEIWEGLKFELRGAAEAYNRLYPPANPGMEAQWDAAQTRLKRMNRDAAGAATEKDSVTVQYHAPATISAIYTNNSPAVFLTVAKGKAGYATLEYDGDEVTLDRACELIAGALLFDDLKHS